MDKYKALRDALEALERDPESIPGTWVIESEMRLDETDVEFIAAANPTAIADLLADRDRLAEEVEALRDDKDRLDWLETQGGILLERLRTSPGPDAVIYWNLEDRDGEYLNADCDPEDMTTLRAAIDSARKE